MKKIISLLLIIAIHLSSFAQQINVYPSHWFTGFKKKDLQVMIHGDNVAAHFPMIKMSANGMQLTTGVKLMKIIRAENPNYIFLDLVIDATAKPGKFSIPFLKDIKLEYELKPRRKGNGTAYAQGVNSSDFIYLLMPDRFSNGNPRNDKVEGYKDQSLNRDTIYDRHGGDLQGVTNHIDYLQNLGVTALWMTPVIENDMSNRTEHGYAFTDHYKIDKRLGGEAAYKALSDSLHNRGMKLVQDAVYNHVGINHFTVVDKPMKDWLHEWPSFTQTTYKDQPLMDPYAAKADKDKMADGWFTRQMPDINQNNSFAANFLIQHAIWSVEEFGIDAWRIDTYIYNDLPFMNRCNTALINEFPKLTMFGETWVHGVTNQAYFVQNNFTNIPFKSNLIGVTDFQTTLYGIHPALTQNFGWTEGVNKLYTTLSNDFVYKNPAANVIFLDNHDMTRIHTVTGENVDKTLMGLGWLLTCRGIPQMYYGTEVLMTGSTHPHDGYVRLDFPGGWERDKKNAFTQTALNANEIKVQNYVQKLANYRKKSSALKTGKLMQFVPNDGLYVYFRYDDKQNIMCVMNTSLKDKTVDFSAYAERTNGYTKATDVITGETYITGFSLKPNTMVIIQMDK